MGGSYPLMKRVYFFCLSLFFFCLEFSFPFSCFRFFSSPQISFSFPQLLFLHSAFPFLLNSCFFLCFAWSVRHSFSPNLFKTLYSSLPALSFVRPFFLLARYRGNLDPYIRDHKAAIPFYLSDILPSTQLIIG